MSRHPPIVHKDNHTIRGRMFCSFLAPVLPKEREDRLAAAGYVLEWADIVYDLERLIETEAEQQHGVTTRGAEREEPARPARPAELRAVVWP
jgi:hypothetical protein